MANAGTNVYWLCEQWQNKTDGKRIETTLDMNSFKDLDAFLKALKKSKIITPEECDKIMDVYYD